MYVFVLCKKIRKTLALVRRLNKPHPMSCPAYTESSLCTTCHDLVDKRVVHCDVDRHTPRWLATFPKCGISASFSDFYLLDRGLASDVGRDSLRGRRWRERTCS